MKYRLAVIGCGNMGSAIVEGLLEQGWAKPEQIIATNPAADKVEELIERLGIQGTTDNVAAAREADIVLLGVKPQIIKAALKELRNTVTPPQLVISIAAGISTRFIEYYLPDVPVARSMPNLAVTVGMGATAICAGQAAKPEDLAQVRAIFEAVGTVEEVHENLMDAVTGLSGTGPMYVFHLIEALADAGVKVGLPRAVAQRLAMQTVRGSARLAQMSDDHPAALKDQVTSPGGTAIAALHVLRKNGFSAILMDAVEAARDRSAELGE
ncbi:MAG: pyrroline-5-carboxylate reductase [Thermoplasmatota archaeon]